MSGERRRRREKESIIRSPKARNFNLISIQFKNGNDSSIRPEINLGILKIGAAAERSGGGEPGYVSEKAENSRTDKEEKWGEI